MRKSVEYSFSDKLVLKEGPPLMIKPAFRKVRCFMIFFIVYLHWRTIFICTHTQRPKGHYTKSRIDEIYGKLKKICREGSKEKEIIFDQGGQNELQLMLYLRYM